MKIFQFNSFLHNVILKNYRTLNQQNFQKNMNLANY